MNLGISGTKSPSELHVILRFILSNSSLNLYDGAYVDGYDERKKTLLKDLWVNGEFRGEWGYNNKFDGKYLIDSCNTNSKVNLFGGEIKNNYFCGLIGGGSKSILTVDGTRIADNYLYGGAEPKRIYSFICKTGIMKDFSISAKNAMVFGGELSTFKTNCVTISGNSSIDNLECNSTSISGGNFVNTKEQNI